MSTMRGRHVFSVLCCILIPAGIAGMACTTDYQKGLEDPRYGQPNALRGQKPAGPTIDNTVGEGGAGAAGTTATPLCTRSGGTLIDAGACAVSFRNDILGAMGVCATASCHLGAVPLSQPPINPTDPAATYAAFAAFTVATKAYVNPCSTDKTQSAIWCNVSKTEPCGTIMPSGTTGLDPAITAKFDTWVACGAPNN